MYFEKNNGSVCRPNRKNRGEDQPTNTTVISSLRIRERNVRTGSHHETDDGKSSDYTRIYCKRHLLLRDMSTAFDRVDRYTMMEDLKHILEEDE